MKPCLLIEGNIADQQLFETCLNEVSPLVNCVVVSDVQQALSLFKRQRKFEPVFLSLDLPEDQSLTLIATLRGMPDRDLIHLVAFSASPGKETAYAAKELGIDGFYVKPPGKNEFKNLLKMFLKG
jgi:CheY-like chemotaxis protein